MKWQLLLSKILNFPFFSGLIPLDIKVTSKVPMGAGLGSSAAFSVALAAAFMRTRQVLQKTVSGSKKEAQQREICDWAFQSEKILHGNPSGKYIFDKNNFDLNIWFLKKWEMASDTICELSFLLLLHIWQIFSSCLQKPWKNNTKSNATFKHVANWQAYLY